MKKILIYIILLLIINNINSQDNTADIKKSPKKEIIKKDTPKDNTKIIDKKDPSEKKDKKKDYIIFGKTILVMNLNPVNKAGIGFSIGGPLLALGGGALFIYDYFGFKNLLYSTKTYGDYQNLYAADIALMAAGAGCIIIGTALLIASFPMIFYKTKDKKTVFYLKVDRNISLGINIKLDFKS